MTFEQLKVLAYKTAHKRSFSETRAVIKKYALCLKEVKPENYDQLAADLNELATNRR